MEANQYINIISPKKNRWKKIAIIFFIVIMLIFIWAGLTRAGYIPNFLGLEILCPKDENNNIDFDNFDLLNVSIEKPVIYLYPTRVSDISVQLDYQGEIIADYPKYDKQAKGWNVTAYPDGKIINHSDNKEYSYLFWEGMPKEKINWDLSKGFIVKGEETKEFLQQKLSEIGLTPKEYNEFIVYWYPLMQNNKYNLIHFADEQYSGSAQLIINPHPDSILRIFMVYKPLQTMVEIQEQKFKPFERNGFTVIEWGGTKAE